MTLSVIDGRLPTIAIPSHYQVTYDRIDLQDEYTFEGHVLVDLKTVETPYSKTSLVLHARDLTLTRAELSCCSNGNSSSTNTYNAVEFRYQLHHQTCEVIFDASEFQWQSNTEYRLKVHFQGFLNDQMAGLYRSHYTDLNGNRMTMATTQFEPTDARRAFPCFDEPALKATFSLTVC